MTLPHLLHVFKGWQYLLCTCHLLKTSACNTLEMQDICGPIHIDQACSCWSARQPVNKCHSPACVQVAAFKDYQPGEGGGASGGGAPAAAAETEPEPAEEEEGGEEPAEGGSGGGDFPPHTVMGLPALSPTMSQGA